MEYNFKKTHTGKDLAISFILIVAGVGLYFINKPLGFFICLCGVVCFFIYKTGYKLNGKGPLLRKKAKSLSRTCKPSLMEYLNGKDITPSVKEGNEGGCIHLIAYFNDEKAYVQLFDYYSFHYEPVTEVIEIPFPKAAKLISQL